MRAGEFESSDVRRGMPATAPHPPPACVCRFAVVVSRCAPLLCDVTKIEAEHKRWCTNDVSSSRSDPPPSHSTLRAALAQPPSRRRNYILPRARSRRPKRETKRLPTDEKTPLFILGEQRAFLSAFLFSFFRPNAARGGPIKFLRFVSRWSALTAQLKEHCLADLLPLAWLPMGKSCFWDK